MRVGIVGTGGVGGLLGGLLARQGAEVALLARGAHARALRERGLHLQGTIGELTVAPAAVAEHGSELGACDVVFVAVKTWQLGGVLADVRAMMREGTIVVPLQNGITAWDWLAGELGDGAVVGGIIFVNSWVAAPGVIRQLGTLGTLVRVILGERAGGTSPRLAAIHDLLVRAGVTVELAADVVLCAWEKFLGFEPMAVVGALARSSLGTFRGDAGARSVLVALMDEVAAIGRAKGVALTADAVVRRLAIIDGLAHDATISMQRDLMAGRPSELMEQSVSLLALARSLGVATPVHDVCVPLLALQEAAARAGGS
jgi:2-dehydropantoate 2-reductase